MADNISRRDFIKSALGITSALSAPTIINYLGQSSPSSDREFLEIRDGNFYMGGEKYTIKGVHYSTRDYPWRMFEQFHPQQIDKELGIAEEMGINTVRVGLMHPYSVGKEDPGEKPRVRTEVEEGYFENFENFLEVAEEHGMKVMPIVFNFTPWAYFKKGNHELGIEYLENWLPEFTSDERILAWDVKNEPEIHQKYFNRKGKGDEYDIPSFTKKMAEEIKGLDHNHPVTIGLSDTHAEPGEVEENLITSLPEYINNEDFYSFHYYVPLKFFDKTVEKIRGRTDKPILLQEFGIATTGNDKHHTEENQERYVREILERGSKENLDGFIVWKFNDHPEDLKNLDIPWGRVYDNESFKEAAFHQGILRTDYSKKPVAYVVQQYYKQIL